MSICCASSIPDQSPREQALLVLDENLDDLCGVEMPQTEDRRNISRSTNSIPRDCLKLILSFALTQKDKSRFRLISRHHHRAYEEFMEPHHRTENLHCLMECNISQKVRKYKSFDDFIDSVPLIPGGTMNLEGDQNIQSLHLFHKQGNKPIIRGLDCHSDLHFISIVIRSNRACYYLDMFYESELLICRFNRSGLVDLCFCNALGNHTKSPFGMNIVQELLFQEGTASLGGVKMWKRQTEIQKISMFVCCCAVLFVCIWWMIKSILDSVML